MFKSGFLLIAALFSALPAVAAPRPESKFDWLLAPTEDVTCAINLERTDGLRTAIEALPAGDEATAYLEATMYHPDSPVMQSTLLDEKKLTDETALNLRAHGYSLSIDYDSNQLALIYEGKRILRWKLDQPIAEVRLHELPDLRLEFALVGWLTTEHYVLEGARVTPNLSPSEAVRGPFNWLWITKEIAQIFEIPYDEKRAQDRNSEYYSSLFRAINDRGVRVSPWVPERQFHDPGEDFARLHELSQRPKPPAGWLRQAVGELAVGLVERAHGICDRLQMEGSILSATYPNQWLGLAADRVRSSHALLEGIARSINEADEGMIRATVLPKPETEPIDDHGRELMVIKILGCSPLVFSVPPDPIAGPRGWGVLRSYSEI